jgi:ribosomal protein S18 acetylase RimI-like enzyme
VTGLPFRLRAPADARDWARARRLVEDYAASLGLDLSFQHLEEELASLDLQYGPPAGAFIVAELASLHGAPERARLVGCVGLRPFEPRVGEIKRLYVAPGHRGSGLGRMLMERLLSEATMLGYERLVLDTLPSMAAARALYESLGFAATSPYRFNPVAGTTYFDRRLP